MKANLLWHTSPGNIDLTREELEELGNDEILIRTEYSFVSQGTEKIVNSGLVPVEIASDMKVPYMKGSFTLPCTYGYSLVGTVIDGPEELMGKVGHIMHPHQDKCVVKIKDFYCFTDQLQPKLGTLISNTETAINALWDGQPEKGSRILIVGMGSIGILTALVLKAYGHKIYFSDVSAERSGDSIELGFLELSEEKNFDLVYHTTATSAGLQQSIDLAGYESRIVDLSWYGSRPVEIKLGTGFHYGRKKLISSQVSHIPRAMSKDWDYKKRKDLAFDLVREFPTITFEEISFQQLSGSFSSLCSKRPFTIIKY